MGGRPGSADPVRRVDDTTINMLIINNHLHISNTVTRTRYASRRVYRARLMISVDKSRRSRRRITWTIPRRIIAAITVSRRKLEPGYRRLVVPGQETWET